MGDSEHEVYDDVELVYMSWRREYLRGVRRHEALGRMVTAVKGINGSRGGGQNEADEMDGQLRSSRAGIGAQF